MWRLQLAEEVKAALTKSLPFLFSRNLVGNIAFSERYGTAYPTVIARSDAAQARIFAEVTRTDADVVALWNTGDFQAAIEYATAWGETQGGMLLKDWTDFWCVLRAVGSATNGALATNPTLLL